MVNISNGYRSYMMVAIIICLVWLLCRQAVPTSKEQTIRTLMRQAGRYAVAAEQDANVVIRVLHAYYAAGYTWAVKDIATADEITRTMGVNFLEWQTKVQRVQDEATRALLLECPNIAPPRSILTQVSGE